MAESVSPNAPDRRPSSIAVGLDSPRSILLIIARDTPERSASSPSDQPRVSRSSFRRAAMRGVGSSILVDMPTLYETQCSRGNGDTAIIIRDARASDLPEILGIYN